MTSFAKLFLNMRLIKVLLRLMLLLVFSAASYAQSPAGSNLWLGQLVKTDQARYKIEGLKQVTFNAQYTNQPYFLSPNQLLYTQAILAENDVEQTDVFRMDLTTLKTQNLTNSVTSEYSPTLMPNNKGISVIRVNEQGKQELWSLSLEGHALANLLPKIEPVGYHVWTANNELALFVLGEPHQLRRADIHDDEEAGQVLSTNPGPSLHLVPLSDFYSHTQQVVNSGESDNPRWQLMIRDTKDHDIVRESIMLPKDGYYYAWTPDGNLLSTHEGQLVIADMASDNKEFVAVSGACTSGISRVAVSKDNLIVLVCDEI